MMEYVPDLEGSAYVKLLETGAYYIFPPPVKGVHQQDGTKLESRSPARLPRVI